MPDEREGNLGWEFTDERIIGSATVLTHAFSPDWPDGKRATFSVRVNCENVPDRDLNTQRDVARVAGKGIALSKILLGRWQALGEYAFQLGTWPGPDIPREDAWSFDDLRDQLLIALYSNVYTGGRAVHIHPTGLALDVGVTRDTADAVLADLIEGGEIIRQPDMATYRMTRQGADRARDIIANKESNALGDSSNYDVFLSHSAVDDELTRRVAEILRLWGLSVFATPHSIPTGFWHPQIESALRESGHLVVIFTEAARTESTWVHQEMGYFLGFKFSQLGDLAQHRVHYVHEAGSSRPGMYLVVQGTKVQTLTSPEHIARAVAATLDIEPSREPLGGLAIPVAPPPTRRPPRYEEFRIGSRSTTGHVGDTPSQTVSLELQSPINIFDLSAALWHPRLEVTSAKGNSQISGGNKGHVEFECKWSSNDSPPPTLRDGRGRLFDHQRPRDPGEDWQPLYLTFETDDGTAWAALIYFQVKQHSKGFPELVFQGGEIPAGFIAARESAQK